MYVRAGGCRKKSCQKSAREEGENLMFWNLELSAQWWEYFYSTVRYGMFIKDYVHMLNWRSIDGGKIETVDLMHWIQPSPDATTRRTKLHFERKFPGETPRLGWDISLTRRFRQRVSMPVVGMLWMKKMAWKL